MGRRSPPKMPLQITTRRSGTPDFKFELLPLHSPLLGQSLLVSFPPLIDMLKFSGYPYLIRGVPSLRNPPPVGRARAGSLAASRRQCEISRSATLQASRPCIPARWQPARARHRRHDRAFTSARALTGDARTGMPPRVPGGAMCVQRFDDSLNSAIHITYRISLRSSSMREPRDPLLKVFFVFVFLALPLLPWRDGRQTGDTLVGWAASFALGPPPGRRPGKQRGSVRREFGSEIAGWRSPRVFRGNRWSRVGSSSNARAPISPLEGWQRRPPCWLLAARRSSDVPDRGHRGPPEAGFHHDASSPRSRRARSNLPVSGGFPRPDPALSTPSSRRRNQGAQSCRRLPHAFSIYLMLLLLL